MAMTPVFITEIQSVSKSEEVESEERRGGTYE